MRCAILTSDEMEKMRSRSSFVFGIAYTMFVEKIGEAETLRRFGPPPERGTTGFAGKKPVAAATDKRTLSPYHEDCERPIAEGSRLSFAF